MNDFRVEVEKVILQTLNNDSYNQICDFAENYESRVLAIWEFFPHNPVFF